MTARRKPDDRDQWKHDKIVEMLRSTDCRLRSAPLRLPLGAEHRRRVTNRAEDEGWRRGTGARCRRDDGRPAHRKITNVNDAGSVRVSQRVPPGRGEIAPFQPPPFATSWINDRGALAVISAVCPVPDYFAHAFALKYYDFLFGTAEATFGGRPVKGSLAGALLATRRYFMEDAQQPTRPRVHPVRVGRCVRAHERSMTGGAVEVDLDPNARRDTADLRRAVAPHRARRIARDRGRRADRL